MKIKINGVEYNGLEEASIKTGLSFYKIRKLKS